MPLSRLPRFRRASAAPNFALTERDRQILRLVHRHRFSRSSHVAAAIAGSCQQILRRLQLLYHHGYLERPRAQLDYYHCGGSREIIYGLGDKGAREIGVPPGRWSEKNRSLLRPQLEHWVLVAEITLAIESACRGQGIRFLTNEALNPTNPTHSIHWKVSTPEGENLGVMPDRVFALDFGDRDPDKRVIACLEADRGTMPVKRQNSAQASIHRKLLAYAASWHEGRHRDMFHFNRFRVLIVTSGKERVDSIIDACSHLERGRGLFLITDRESFAGAPDPLTFEWRSGKAGEATTLLS